MKNPRHKTKASAPKGAPVLACAKSGPTKDAHVYQTQADVRGGRASRATASVRSKPTKTHQGMLHQSPALEVTTDPRSQEMAKTAVASRHKTAQLAPNIVEMREPSMTAPSPAKAESPHGESIGRRYADVFVLGKDKT